MRAQLSWLAVEATLASRLQRWYRRVSEEVAARQRMAALAYLRRRVLQLHRRRAFATWARFPSCRREGQAAAAEQVRRQLALSLSDRNAEPVRLAAFAHWQRVAQLRSRVDELRRSCVRGVLRWAYMRWLKAASVRVPWDPTLRHAVAKAEFNWAAVVRRRVLHRRFAVWVHFYIERLEEKRAEAASTNDAAAVGDR